mgnify:CR=1 FL=1
MALTGLEPATPTLSILQIDFYTVFLHKLIPLSPINQDRYDYLCNMSLLILLFLEILCNFCAVCIKNNNRDEGRVYLFSTIHTTCVECMWQHISASGFNYFGLVPI